MFYVLGGLFLASTGLQCWKNSMANSYIKRRGNIITKDRRSFGEKASSFIKDYAYLIIPGLNLFMAGKRFVKNDIAYSTERLSKLTEYERIIDAKTAKELQSQAKEVKKVPACTRELPERTPQATKEVKRVPANTVELPERKPTRAPEMVPLRNGIPANTKGTAQTVEEMIDNMISGINISENIEYVQMVKQTYRAKSRELRAEYQAENSKPSPNAARKHDIAQKVKYYDRIFVAARDRLVALSETHSSARTLR